MRSRITPRQISASTPVGDKTSGSAGKRPKAASSSPQEAINISRRWNSGFLRQKIASANGTAKLAMSHLDNGESRGVEWVFLLDRELDNAYGVQTPTMTMATASPTPNHPSLRCRRTLCERTSVDCRMKNNTHAGNTMAWMYRTNGGSGEGCIRLWSMVWLKPYTTVAAISSDMKK